MVLLCVYRVSVGRGEEGYIGGRLSKVRVEARIGNVPVMYVRKCVSQGRSMAP